MNSFPPRMPWSELYVRSGLKTLSDRVRHRPIVRRVRNAVGDLRTSVQTVARQQLPGAAAAAQVFVNRMLGDGDRKQTSIINATGILAPGGFCLPIADAAIAAMSAATAGYSTASAEMESLLRNLSGAEA